MDWTNLQEVVKLCTKLNNRGGDSVVYKDPSRDNYNITFMSRITDTRFVSEYRQCKVIFTKLGYTGAEKFL